MPRITTSPAQLDRVCSLLQLPAGAGAAIVSAITAENLQAKYEPKPHNGGRPGWSKEAAALREPLAQLCRDLRSRRSAFISRYGTYMVAPPKGGKSLFGSEVYDLYAERCESLLDRITHTLIAAGHLRSKTETRAQTSLSILVANEKADGAHAGQHWAEWEDPKVARRIRRMFDQLYEVYAQDTRKSPVRRRIPYFDTQAQSLLVDTWMSAFSVDFGTQEDSADALRNAVDMLNNHPDTFQAMIVEAVLPLREMLTSSAFRAMLKDTAADAAMRHQRPPTYTPSATELMHDPAASAHPRYAPLMDSLPSDWQLRLLTHVEEAEAALDIAEATCKARSTLPAGYRRSNWPPAHLPRKGDAALAARSSMRAEQD